MGAVCTRRCGFCAVGSGKPEPIDKGEPAHVAEHARSLGLKHVVITSVTRDDLHDGGARHFVETISAVRAAIPVARVEVLTPDFQGDAESIDLVCNARPDIFNHNVETVERLTPSVRSAARYRRSLDVLRRAKGTLGGGFIKSGIMLGLGERMDEVRATLEDLRGVGCDFITIGQYLPPSRNALPVADYVDPEAFDELREVAGEMGFRRVFAGPLVRSSYMADAMV
jgi:lipoic acid synthetase